MIQISKWSVTNNNIIKDGIYYRFARLLDSQLGFMQRSNEIYFIQNYNKNFYETLPILKYGWDENKMFFLQTKFEPKLKNFYELEFTVENLKEIFNIINKLHKLPFKKTYISEFDLIGQIKWFKKHIKNFYEWNEIEAIIKNLQKTIDSNKVVLSHNDLNLNNIVNIKGVIKIIDFEYLYLNDPFYDIASFISESIYNNSYLIEIWLKLWNLTLEQKQKVMLWIKYQNYLNILWSQYMFELTNLSVFKKIQNLKIKNLKNPLKF